MANGRYICSCQQSGIIPDENECSTRDKSSARYALFVSSWWDDMIPVSLGFPALGRAKVLQWSRISLAASHGIP